MNIAKIWEWCEIPWKTSLLLRKRSDFIALFELSVKILSTFKHKADCMLLRLVPLNWSLMGGFCQKMKIRMICRDSQTQFFSQKSAWI